MNLLRHLYDVTNPHVFWSAISGTAAAVALAGAVARWLVIRHRVSTSTDALVAEFLQRLDDIARLLVETGEMTGREAYSDPERCHREIPENFRRIADASAAVVHLSNESRLELRKNSRALAAVTRFELRVAPLLERLGRHNPISLDLEKLNREVSGAGMEVAKTIQSLRG